MYTANRLTRKRMGRLARQGYRTVRVVGSVDDGFRLVVHTKNSTTIVGPVAGFGRQKDAVNYSRRKFGQKAAKLMLKAA
jgi:hypothetical protein